MRLVEDSFETSARITAAPSIMIDRTWISWIHVWNFKRTNQILARDSYSRIDIFFEVTIRLCLNYFGLGAWWLFRLNRYFSCQCLSRIIAMVGTETSPWTWHELTSDNTGIYLLQDDSTADIVQHVGVSIEGTFSDDGLMICQSEEV